jgi:hypothetical protein
MTSRGNGEKQRGCDHAFTRAGPAAGVRMALCEGSELATVSVWHRGLPAEQGLQGDRKEQPGGTRAADMGYDRQRGALTDS